MRREVNISNYVAEIMRKSMREERNGVTRWRKEKKQF